MSDRDVSLVMDAGAARVLTDEVKADAHALWVKLLALYNGGAHVALGYSSWADYAREEFGHSKSHAYRLIDAARVVSELPESPMGERPPSERVARELAPLRDDPEAMRDAQAAAVERHGPSPTAAQVREVVQERVNADAPSPPDGCLLPHELKAALQREFGFTGQAREEDGIVQIVSPGTISANPPAARAGRWAQAASKASEYDRTLVVAVLPASTAEPWWWEFAIGQEVRFLADPLVWVESGEERRLPSAIVVFGRRACVKWWRWRQLPNTVPAPPPPPTSAAVEAANPDEAELSPGAELDADALIAEEAIARLRTKGLA